MIDERKLVLIPIVTYKNIARLQHIFRNNIIINCDKFKSPMYKAVWVLSTIPRIMAYITFAANKIRKPSFSWHFNQHSQPYSQWWHCHCISSLFYFSIFKTYIKDKIWNLVMHLRQRREKRGNYRESTKTAGLFSKSRTGVSSSGRFQRQKAAAFVGTTYNLRQWPNKCQSLHKPSRSWLVSVKLLTLTAEMQQNDFMSL